jgi:hypothetical protein
MTFDEWLDSKMAHWTWGREQFDQTSLSNMRLAFEAGQRSSQPEAAAEYAKRNPLGGPAVVFEAMASRIRAGEDYYDVLDDYGFMVKPSSSGPQGGRP